MREPPSTTEPELSPREVYELSRSGRAVLVDVREPYERAAGFVEGSLHVPMEALAQAAPALARDLPLVFQCRVGGRSAVAADAFRRAGFDAYNMSGGLVAWVAEGLPLAPPDGYVADH